MKGIVGNQARNVVMRRMPSPAAANVTLVETGSRSECDVVMSRRCERWTQTGYPAWSFDARHRSLCAAFQEALRQVVRFE